MLNLAQGATNLKQTKMETVQGTVGTGMKLRYRNIRKHREKLIHKIRVLSVGWIEIIYSLALDLALLRAASAISARSSDSSSSCWTFLNLAMLALPASSASSACLL